MPTDYQLKPTKIRGDGIVCGKDEHLREVFFMISGKMKEIIINLHVDLNKSTDEAKSSYLLSQATTKLFNIVNCREKDYYGKNE